MPWKHNLLNLFEVLDTMVVTDGAGVVLDTDAGFSLLVGWVKECREQRRRVYFVGNGASASMASHFSADLGKMAGVPTEVFTDCALITATGNDMGYDQTFAYPLGQRMVPGEILVAISSSGNSPNAVAAVRMAGRLSGRTVTFTAMSPDNAMRSLGDLNFYLPAQTYGMAECGHGIALHHLVDLF
ncbi:MAG: SIS domain-containing protein [Pseudodesulfovibrio sp.]|uniref:Sugar isomerase (SIS) n=1 Tax=Pseudodesulfovibrio aespoeensis (strain ATCC 700646 / DSM 10631 / Aspo-2) TaxID=643562 RepID=E6VR04_PSEA9|nr:MULTISPECIES: SIS domain-containing protein [Pseudodesulfovibrio]MBU4191456.1 SIS domain-containing protein [Pseudomonadota bacterium]ADU62984.1 sugar isomerase (SIS) [Pseudodesulfovibrio aespoeensis Aspo-2]MBU4380235.1 SIS domain-containing protein [Pseudomonadota bacterium]MBU4475912.1 SIS domain-containing protein [Pseudomonadota bacterium]MBU4516750.1 SIS domain-containing protein [Pseudomonadota bacterium]